jgi:hypothetical protein
MPKPPTRMSRKLVQAPVLSRTLIKKENRQRVMQLVKTVRENGRGAKQLASLVRIPETLPPAVVRDFQAVAERASKTVSRKARRIKR